MKISNFFHTIVSFFERKKYSEEYYLIDEENISICFFDMPHAAFYVIKKYGWMVFFHKTINYARYIFKKYSNKMTTLCQQVIFSFRNEGFRKGMSLIFKYIFCREGVLSKNVSEGDDYERWIEKNEKFDVAKIKKEIES